ncbi:hypothetical protein L7F22_006644 [Adiantum nelumboides]|nr:hypothetical protein [Adiantum nelumboides]
MVNPRCFLDISIGGESEGRIVIELYPDVVPRTVENFRVLCTGELGSSPKTGVPLHYKGVPFHRVARGLIQGGDISAHEGSGGESIYGPTFDDENFQLKHERKGMLSMANVGPNSNGSQFFIATTRLPQLDGKHVVFGKVVKGMGVIRNIEHVPTDEDGIPLRDVFIEDCGQILEGDDDGVAGFFKDGDTYPEYPADLAEQPESCLWWVDAVDSSKTFGNNSYKKGDYKMALRKYRKALRYLDVCWEKDGLDEDKTDYLRIVKTHILTNSSACKLKLGDARGALLDTEFATRNGIENAKALFRQGQVSIHAWIKLSCI